MKYLLAIIMVGFIFCIQAESAIYKVILPDGSIYFTNMIKSENNNISTNTITIKKETESNINPTYNKIKENVVPLLNDSKSKDDIQKQEFHSIVDETAKIYNIDHRLIKSVIKVESNWNHKSISPKGAMGLMQLMPATARDLGINNPFNPKDNIDGGVRYIKYLMDKFGSNLPLTLAAYNAGPTVVEKKMAIPKITETINYVKNVLYHYNNGTTSEHIPVQNNNRTTLKHIPAPQEERQVNDKNNEKQTIAKQDKIIKIILKDGSIIFTNSRFVSLMNIISEE